MDTKDFKNIVKYLLHSCPGLSQRQVSKLYGLQFVKYFSLRDIKTVYRIAIDNAVNPVCPWCNQAITDVDDLTIDHIYPKSKGGSDHITNLQPMHRRCNENKGAILPGADTDYIISINLTVRKHYRSDREKYRAHNRQVVIKDSDADDLTKKCEKYDNTRKSVFRTKGVKKR